MARHFCNFWSFSQTCTLFQSSSLTSIHLLFFIGVSFRELTLSFSFVRCSCLQNRTRNKRSDEVIRATRNFSAFPHLHASFPAVNQGKDGLWNGVHWLFVVVLFVTSFHNSSNDVVIVIVMVTSRTEVVCRALLKTHNLCLHDHNHHSFSVA